MKTKFKEYIVEYYKGKHSTIGFRYSEPKLKSNLKLLIFSDKSISELENILDDKIDQLLDKHFLEIDVVEDPDIMTQSVEGLPPQLVNIIIGSRMTLYQVAIDLTTYDEDEILSFIMELADKDSVGKYIIAQTALLNDKPFDTHANHRAKTKIGFKNIK